MALVEFNDKFSSAHSVADTGGEFVVAKELDLSYILVCIRHCCTQRLPPPPDACTR
jgi:hypothetical protein